MVSLVKEMTSLKMKENKETVAVCIIAYLVLGSRYPISSSDSTAFVKTFWTLIILPLALSATANVFIHSLLPHPGGPTTNICKVIKHVRLHEFHKMMCDLIVSKIYKNI